ncbi:unnamed protein product [Protopolystoma xenopodis]|uniref:Uncharacterized protein n=1 Tax=Protopolystoma xenopodis TaxID=117903 RepID=A0A448XMM1_9PLAT|nr:unnamed protein product [Protopolystoma xenopodis]
MQSLLTPLIETTVRQIFLESSATSWCTRRLLSRHMALWRQALAIRRRDLAAAQRIASWQLVAPGPALATSRVPVAACLSRAGLGLRALATHQHLDCDDCSIVDGSEAMMSDCNVGSSTIGVDSFLKCDTNLKHRASGLLDSDVRLDHLPTLPTEHNDHYDCIPIEGSLADAELSDVKTNEEENGFIIPFFELKRRRFSKWAAQADAKITWSPIPPPVNCLIDQPIGLIGFGADDIARYESLAQQSSSGEIRSLILWLLTKLSAFPRLLLLPQQPPNSQQPKRIRVSVPLSQGENHPSSRRTAVRQNWLISERLSPSCHIALLDGLVWLGEKAAKRLTMPANLSQSRPGEQESSSNAFFIFTYLSAPKLLIHFARFV